MGLRLPEPLDDGGVGHAAALAHGLEAPPAAAALELAHEGGEKTGPVSAYICLNVGKPRDPPLRPLPGSGPSSFYILGLS